MRRSQDWKSPLSLWCLILFLLIVTHWDTALSRVGAVLIGHLMNHHTCANHYQGSVGVEMVFVKRSSPAIP